MAGVKRYKKGDAVSYALGITLTMELLKQKPQYVERVYVHSAMKNGETLDGIQALCHAARVEMVWSDKPFHTLSQKENCFVIGMFRKFPETLKQAKDASHIVLVNPSNAGNLGTIIRSALGFGINHLAIIRPAVDIFDPKTVRASMGTLFYTDYEYFDTFEAYREQYGDREMYPFMLDAKLTIHEMDVKGKCALIFGNEATGLPDCFHDVGDSVIIPHTDKIDSLNLPIAASIAMFQATRNIFDRKG